VKSTNCSLCNLYYFCHIPLLMDMRITVMSKEVLNVKSDHTGLFIFYINQTLSKTHNSEDNLQWIHSSRFYLI